MDTTTPPAPDAALEAVLAAARDALRTAPPLDDPAYLRYPAALADRLTAHWPALREANAADLAAARARGLPQPLVDRLRLDPAHLRYLLKLTESVRGAQPAVLADTRVRRAGGWGELRAVAKPLGVLLMVYEARPTVTVEGALLGPAVGNAVLLRGGREIAATNAAMARAIRGALGDAGLPPALATVLDDPDRSRLRALLKRSDAVDVLIPRGSPSLIDYCRSASSIPVIASGGGVNHLYVHASADLELAARATLDSKIPEPTACNTVEVVLVDRAVAPRFVQALARAARRAGDPVEIRVDAHRLPGLAGDDLAGDDTVRFAALGPADFGREFLDATVAVHEVDGIDDALAHVERHGTGHTEGVIAADRDAVRRFRSRVDAAALVVNGSLRLHDGPTLGLGPELAISTGRLHARGPVTLADLVTRAWLVDAAGTLRADADRQSAPPASSDPIASDPIDAPSASPAVPAPAHAAASPALEPAK